MKKVLYIEASPRKERSHSIKIAKEYISKVTENKSDVDVKTIDLWSANLPEFDGDMMDAIFLYEAMPQHIKLFS